MRKHFLPYDVYERHRKIGSLINAEDEILDVGGELDHLSQFCEPKKITVANLTGGDVVIKKGKLPFKNNSFTTVTAIDVLEHIPKKERSSFVNELLRVSKIRVIISFPLGTPNHQNYEARIEKWLESKGHNVSYLKEHIKFGLPKKEEITKMTKGYKNNLQFAGNLKVSALLFKLFLFDPNVKYVRKAVYYVKLMFNLITNPIFYVLLSSRKFSESTVRAYLVINK